MNKARKNMERKGWIAAVAGFTMPGMGQIYNGELLKGLCFFIISVVTPFTGLWLSTRLTDRCLFMGVITTAVLSLAVYAFAIIEAFRNASRQRIEYDLKAYNRWCFYVAMWMLGSLIITSFAWSYTRKNVIECYKIVTESMKPEVLKGDRVIVDKTAYKRVSPKVGDVVVFTFPDDRRKVYIKRIEGLPGDRIKLEDGQEYTVPHATIYVLGDNRKSSHDSRKFGSVPLRDMLGKARQVYYSSGPDGVRWNRIGRTINSSPE